MLTLQQVKLPVSHTREDLEKKIVKTLKISSQTFSLEDPEAVPGCQKKARTVFCIHNRCFRKERKQSFKKG